ncbi:MAG: hypothetical protein AB8F78_14990 [Saprospiraceae bacterium]
MATDKTKLLKTEALLKAAGYSLRYERGHFRAGYCVVHERKVIVVNRFFDPAARILKLRELIAGLALSYDDLPEEHHELFADILKTNPVTETES